jgi:hypothetical protein
MKKSLACATVASFIVVAAACNRKDTTSDTGQSKAVVTFTPTCGDVGTPVEISVLDKDGILGSVVPSDYAIRFHPGVPATATSVVFADDVVVLDTTVPGGAQTGTIVVSPDETSFKTYESVDAFQIPCPPDAGQPDSGTGVPPGTPPPPPLEYGGSFTVAGGGTDSQFFATFLKAGSPSALAEERKAALSLVAPDGVAKGTCVKQTQTAGSPPLDGADVGPVQLLAGGSVVATADPQTAGTSTQYSVLVPGTPAEIIATLTDPANAKTFKPLPVPAPPSVTSPDISGNVTVPAGSGLTLTYAPSTATNMTLSLTNVTTADTFDCVLDPAAGSFAIPPSALSATGSWFANLIAGNVVSDELDGREVLELSNAAVNFTIAVQ